MSRLDGLAGERERFAFWANAYNLLAIKAVLDQYPTRSIRDGGSLLQPIWKKKVGTVAGREYALDDIEHGILRREFKEPRVHFAIVCASLSCPDLRPEPFGAERLDAQLDEQTRAFLANPTKGLAPGAERHDRPRLVDLQVVPRRLRGGGGRGRVHPRQGGPRRGGPGGRPHRRRPQLPRLRLEPERRGPRALTPGPPSPAGPGRAPATSPWGTSRRAAPHRFSPGPRRARAASCRTPLLAKTVSA